MKAQEERDVKIADKAQLMSDGIKCALILLFCYTAISKWLFYHDFMYQLRQSPFLQGGYTFFSFALPGAELSISALLVMPSTAKAGFAAAALLLIVFTIYIVCMLLYAPHVPCSCGGFLSGLSWKQHIGLNTILAVLSIVGYRTEGGVTQRIM